jgi:hypothetical protein
MQVKCSPKPPRSTVGANGCQMRRARWGCNLLRTNGSNVTQSSSSGAAAEKRVWGVCELSTQFHFFTQGSHCDCCLLWRTHRLIPIFSSTTLSMTRMDGKGNNHAITSSMSQCVAVGGVVLPTNLAYPTQPWAGCGARCVKQPSGQIPGATSIEGYDNNSAQNHLVLRPKQGR